jgi:ribosomal protein S18 acetylase RimI-like enzyme
VLDSDAAARAAFTACGYQEVERTTLLRCDLGRFEAPMDRRQMQARRQMVVEVTADAPTHAWWEASTLGEFDLTRFELVPRGGGSVVATATFRSMESSGVTSAGRAAGLIGFSVDPSCRRRGLAMFLLSEALRQFLRQGILHVEVQARQTNVVALEMLRKLGFDEIEQGGVWKKSE